jgi:hypothetical protein
MTHIVEWSDEMLDRLADLYLVSPEPSRVTSADHRIHSMLKRSPETAGRLLAEGLWLVEVDPLRVHYEILKDDLRVRIHDVQATFGP